jgi:hypothetical protein
MHERIGGRKWRAFEPLAGDETVGGPSWMRRCPSALKIRARSAGIASVEFAARNLCNQPQQPAAQRIARPTHIVPAPAIGSSRRSEQHPPTTRPLGLTTQVSGYQASDGKIYIGADAFDRSQGVSMYRVDDLTQITHREHWQPWNPTDHTWGTAGQPATTTITPFGQNWGEISLREIDGKPVLASTNFNQDPRASPRSRCMAQPAWQTRLDRRSWS